MKDSWKIIAEILADKLIEVEKEAAVENDLWWARFLKSQGLVHLWRKGIIARHMLIEERCEGGKP